MNMLEIEVSLSKLNGKQEELYDKLTVKFIRERYSLSQELSLNRQKDRKPEQWQEFDNYCEECKARARAIVYAE